MLATRESVDDVLTRHLDDGTVPGAISAVVRGDDVTVDVRGTTGHGSTGPGTTGADAVPLRRDTIVRIASVTKPIVAAAAMTLVEDGLLDLDDPVEAWLPELADRRVLRHPGADLDDTVPAVRPITVEDLLSFRLGIGVWPEFGADLPIQLAYGAAALGGDAPPGTQPTPAPDEWMRRLGALPLIAQPGERWLYNTGADALGVLLARLTGGSLGDVLAERVFAPLGMRDTGFCVPDPDRFCPLYLPGDDGGFTEFDPVDGNWSTPPAFESAGGGLVSTVDDLLAFTRMFRDGGGSLLAPCSVSEMTTDRLTPGQRADGGMFLGGEGWGLGMAVDERGRYGWDGGTGVGWRSDPATDTTSILLTQVLFASEAGPRMLAEFRAAAHG